MKRRAPAFAILGICLLMGGCALTTRANSRRSRPLALAGHSDELAPELRLCTIEDLFAAEFDQTALPPAVWLAERCRCPEDKAVEESDPSAMLSPKDLVD